MMKRSLLTRGGHTSSDTFVIPILRAVKMLGGEAHADQVFAKMADLIDLTQRDFQITYGNQPYYYRGASFITARLRSAKLLEPPTGDVMLRITRAGLVLAGERHV